MTVPNPELACPNCSYQLNGLALSNGKATCPECGATATPIPLDTFYTHKHMHGELAKRVLLPTTIPFLLTAASMYIEEIMTTAGLLMLIAFPFIALFVALFQYFHSIEHNSRSPQKISKLTISLWILAYSIPGVMSCYLLFSTWMEAIFVGL